MMFWPNLVTFFRLVSAPFVSYFILAGDIRLAFFLFLFASFTDMVDGFLARRLGARSRFGLYLDPLADKILLTMAYVALGTAGLLPQWIVWLTVARDLLILLGALYLYAHHARSLNPIWSGKLNTLVQSLLVIYTLLTAAFGFSARFSDLLVAATTVTLFASFMGYSVRSFAILHPNRKKHHGH